jgi:hypothetical protein
MRVDRLVANADHVTKQKNKYHVPFLLISQHLFRQDFDFGGNYILQNLIHLRAVLVVVWFWLICVVLRLWRGARSVALREDLRRQEIGRQRRNINELSFHARFFIAENWCGGGKEHVVMENDTLDHFEVVVRELLMNDCCDVVGVQRFSSAADPSSCVVFRVFSVCALGRRVNLAVPLGPESKNGDRRVSKTILGCDIGDGRNRQLVNSS